MLNTARTIEARVQLARAKMDYFIACSDVLTDADRSMREALELAATALEVSRDFDYLRTVWLLDGIDEIVVKGNLDQFAESMRGLAASATDFDLAFRQFADHYGKLLGQAVIVHISGHGSWAKELPETLEAREANPLVDMNNCAAAIPPAKMQRSRLRVSRLPVLEVGKPLGDTNFSRSEMYGDDGR